MIHETLTQDDIVLRVRSLEGREGYVAGMLMATRLLEARVKEHRWWMGSLRSDVLRHIETMKLSADLVEGGPLKPNGTASERDAQDVSRERK